MTEEQIKQIEEILHYKYFVHKFDWVYTFKMYPCRLNYIMINVKFKIITPCYEYYDENGKLHYGTVAMTYKELKKIIKVCEDVLGW